MPQQRLALQRPPLSQKLKRRPHRNVHVAWWPIGARPRPEKDKHKFSSTRLGTVNGAWTSLGGPWDRAKPGGFPGQFGAVLFFGCHAPLSTFAFSSCFVAAGNCLKSKPVLASPVQNSVTSLPGGHVHKSDNGPLPALAAARPPKRTWTPICGA